MCNKKKYISCDLIEHGFDTHLESINFCCRSSNSGGGFKPLISNYHGEKIDWYSFFEIKNSYRKQMREGNMIPECEGCIYLKEKEWDDENYISFINFNNGIACNCNCIYCYLHQVRQDHNSYPILPIIQDMIKNNILKAGGHITFAGGEPTAEKEFGELLNTLVDLGLDGIRVLTNGIKFSEALEKGIRLGVVSTVISIDSGTSETYKKIKRVDASDAAWDNLKRYSLAKKQDYQVQSKYIIIPGINDTYEEIDTFIKKSKEATIRNIAIDIEQFWFTDNQDNLPQSIYEILNYFIKKVIEANIKIKPIDRASMLLAKMSKNCLSN